MTNELLVIYTTSAFECPWCIKAKELLNIYGVDFYEKDIHTNSNYREEFLEKGFRTVPQVLRGEEVVGGHDNLKLWLRSNHNSRAEYERKAEEYGF